MKMSKKKIHKTSKTAEMFSSSSTQHTYYWVEKELRTVVRKNSVVVARFYHSLTIPNPHLVYTSIVTITF